LDPEFYGELYSSNRKLDKYKWWTNLAGADRSSFATVSHDLHRLRRGPLNPFFSARSVVALEPMIRSKIEKLSARFCALAETGEVFRLDAAFMALTMDIICDYAFARDRKYLDDADFNLQWKQTIIGAFEGGAVGRHFPFMLPLMRRIPRSLLARLDRSVSHHFYWQGIVREQVKPILAEKRGVDDKTQGDDDARAATIFHALRDSNLPAEEKTLERLCDEALILTGAGSETTAQVLTRLFFYLKHVPNTLVRLREELDSLMPNATDIPSWTELQQLPYLVFHVTSSMHLMQCSDDSV
jgi:cytochrome P450